METLRLRLIVTDEFGVDVMTPSRKREAVNARIVFSNILFEKGYGCSAIGRILKKDHATALHYKRSFEGYVKTDRELRIKYKKCLHRYDMDNDDNVYDLTDIELRTEIFSLKNKLNSLSLDYEDVDKELSKLRTRINRFRNIIELLEQKLPEDKEHEVYSKLNSILNGMQH